MSEYQTPFFLFDLEKVTYRYERISEAFPGAAIYYAVKANNHGEVLKTLVSSGSKFDIGSKHEAELILELGVEPRDMVFSAPIKLQSHIRDTFEMGLDHFVFDSEDELSKLALLAPGSRVMVRLSVDNKGSFFPLSMKFGAPPEEAASLLMAAGEMGLDPYGIAFHVGSQCTCKQTWRRAMESAAEVNATLEKDGVKCRALDIGGGFPIKYSDDVPSIEEIAEEVYDVFDSDFPAGTELIIEPGRYLVGESAVLASTVIGRARRADENWLFLDASAFHGLLEAQQVNGRFPYPVKATHNGQQKKKYVLSGPTCDPDDTILAEVWLPEVKVGDKLFILNTGAYSFVYATNFHGFAPPDIHFIHKDESIESLASLWGEQAEEQGFEPEFDEEKRYVYEHEGQTGVVYFAITTIPEKWHEALWEIYDESLHMDESVQDQSCYDHDTFVSSLTDPDYRKGLLVVDGEPVALMTGATTLEKAAVAYINPEFIRQKYPREVEEGRFWYITTFFISPRLRSMGFVKLMCAALFTGIHERKLVLGGDFTDSRTFLADFVENVSEEVGMPIKKHLLGTQSYYAFTVEPGRDDAKLPEGMMETSGKAEEAAKSTPAGRVTQVQS
jgi:ornithine decarboxylase